MTNEMTKEQAIDIIKCLAWHGRPEEEKIEQAIETLEQQLTTQEILSHIETGITATGQSDSYCVGFCNALIWLKACITHEEPQFYEDGRGKDND